MAEYIERGAVEIVLENAQLISDGEYNGYCTADVCLGLDSIPAADVVEVRHGYWADGIGSWSTARCSVCNWKIPYSEDGYMGKTNYCPNCGAKMDGKGDGDV